MTQTPSPNPHADAIPPRGGRVLILRVGKKPEAIASTHAEAFETFAGPLRRRLGVTSTQEALTDLSQIAPALDRTPCDIALILPTWRDSAEQVIAAFKDLHARPKRPALVVLDWYAPTSSPHFGVLPYVDRYLKRSLLVDFAEYRTPYVGGYAVADFVSRTQKLDLGTWNFGSEIPAGQEHKLWLGWNFGVGTTYRKLLLAGRVLGRSWRARPVEVNRRLGPPKASSAPNEWYQAYRDAALHAVDALVPRYRCSGYERIPRKQYIWELLRSKIVLSPFGWGEICFRDYEAVACGALLVKPSMTHQVTSPNIYVDHETYVPLKWDLSDAVEAITYYLENPDEGARIARAGQRALRDYFARDQFVDDVARSLRGILAHQEHPALPNTDARVRFA